MVGAGGRIAVQAGSDAAPQHPELFVLDNADIKVTPSDTMSVAAEMAGSDLGTGPTSGSLYIVDSFLVVTLGGAASLLGTVASAFGIAQTQSIAEFFMTGSNAKVLTLLLVVTILMIRPQGLFAAKVRR